jgi:hypothetical protein
MSVKSALTQNINTIIGTALLASVALAAIMIIVDVSVTAEEEFIYLTVEHRISKYLKAEDVADL